MISLIGSALRAVVSGRPRLPPCTAQGPRRGPTTDAAGAPPTPPRVRHQPKWKVKPQPREYTHWELARGLEPLTCCFSAGRVEALWQGAVVWRLTLSDASWTPIVFDHLAIAEPESVGQSVGREWGPDRLRVSDIQACDDCFGVRAGPPWEASIGRRRTVSVRGPAAGRQRCDWLAVWLSAQPRWGATTSWSRTPRRRR